VPKINLRASSSLISIFSQALSWSVTGGTGQSLFNIDSATGAISVANGAALDLESTPSYTLNVAVDDEDADTTADASTVVTVNLTNVNEKPALSAPASQSVKQNTATAITGISVADPDAGTDPIEVTLSAPTGTFTATSDSAVTVSGGSTISITLAGQQSDINAFIAASRVTYTTAAGATGSVTLTIGSNDGQIPPLTDSKTETLDIITNAIPVITNLASDTLRFTEGASAAVIDQGIAATVTDTDSANFDTGTLTVSITSNRNSGEDVLDIRNEGSGAGQISVASYVSYEGTQIARFTGGTGTSNLVITFNNAATPAAVQALVRAITYLNTDTIDPSTAARTVRFVLTDGDGGTSINTDTTVNVIAVNDAPAITSNGGGDSASISTAENTTAVTTVTASDPDLPAQTLSYSISGGADQARFNINASTGVLTFVSAPDFEAPGDADANNRYGP